MKKAIGHFEEVGKVRKEELEAKRIKRTAYHEAGHAVVAYFLADEAADLNTTIVDSDEERLDHWANCLAVANQLSRKSPLPSSRHDLIKVREPSMIILMAGPEAEERAFDSYEPGRAIHDYQYVMSLSCGMHANMDSVSAHIQYCRTIAQTFVKKAWPDVEAVAAALLENRRLTDAQTRSAVKQVLRARNE